MDHFNSNSDVFPRTACGGHDNMFVFNMSCYRFVTDKVNFMTARSECESQPGFHLVFIQTSGEQGFIQDTAALITPQSDFWIGIEKVDGVKQWMDGSETTYTNYGLENEEGACWRVKRAQDYEWHDRKCEKDFGYICEREIGKYM